ncbi:putative fimbrial biogenesis outer membrane usher protein [Klebsiella pneumoniae]|uniref:Putative fimbrial biogenesis outer membrane usher protein n=1 Tax=Klebsiella pneumoniae TaxID=573 RepID=A0A377WDS1_KLEPN|nr:putative fimbrial biogenesis outer membrane usher protein [Klebsiella pneumoniae]
MRRLFAVSPKTNARVVIKQNGYQVYQTYVAPGAFEITDMYPSGGSGDLYVSVEESDGSKQEFVVPFASPTGHGA